MEQNKSAGVEGSGAIAQDGGVVADNGGAAVGGDVSQSPIITGDHNVVTVTYQGVEVTIPSPKAISAHRAALQDWLEKDAGARCGGMSVYIQEEGATLPIEASPYQTGRLGPRENMLELLRNADRLLVLGEPGSGKTVALERLAWELCAGSDPKVPVLIPLFHYAGTDLEEWVRAFLQKMDQLRLDDKRTSAAFLKEGEVQCCFLFDGLNEVPPPYRDRLVDELVRWMAAYPRHPVVLTSRAQDELWRRLRGEVSRAVMVQSISDEQARAYLVAHLEERGDALYGRLDMRLREMARRPLILWLVKEAGAAGEALPGNRGELYERFVSRMLRRDTDRRLDAEIPERVKHRTLADLAYHLSLEQRLSCPRGEAVAVVSPQLGEDLAEAVVGACQRHGLLTGDEESVWFAPHQTVQEHFAALALRDVAEREWRMSRWARLGRAGQRLLGGEEKGLAGLAADDWWMETFVQLAGLVDDANRLTREVARANPWLAWWCVEEGREVGEETREAVADRSGRLLESDRVADRRRAVTALGQMRNERVVEPLFRAAADANIEVAALAVQALAEMGEAARNQIAKALRGQDRRLWLAALRYLVERPGDLLCADIAEKVWEEALGLPMTRVPPGLFWMGSDETRGPQAYNAELPQHQVDLAGYWIGRYPVTVAQFRSFLEATGCRGRGSGGRPEMPQEKDDHPAVNIAWFDARAYCEWLGQRSGLPVRLPTEAEWEKAARGTDGRIYPWGDEAPDEKRCNFDDNVGGTTPVGQYSPYGDSPHGCADMAGNVWEWCATKWQGSYQEYRNDNDPEGNAPRVLRGGAFNYHQNYVRCAYRYRDDPHLTYYFNGFRIVVAPGFQ